MSKIPSQLGNPGHSTISINTNTMNNIPRNNNLGLQVITIKPDGSLCGLDHKKKGLDLRQFGKARIERVTLIEWDENEQGWEVFRTAPNTLSKPWGAGLARELGVDPEKLLGRVLECKERVLFQEYEDAVKFEVALIQAMQVSGKGDQVFGK